ncbi:BMP family ABC transporter substrate-binding protein [Acidisoma cellulosilytica]|uniref:BMP family ABC transporter substrate-binding protein n=1 Tax=Acidisoma cellulosilyticum TaxID=2802395 RepID=A0A963Z4Q5_9PROT|nr:BMP family ABC transporter substrate-binding protein [Acidisoma cellulosilyticum]MCB8882742.1 BMP family ABC transporter substrate-binding protein [Acidisoma cellulosilyticum]
MVKITPTRRSVLLGGAAAAGTALIGGRGAEAASMTVGFIYVGSRDDFGYNQSHAEGAAAVRKMPGLTVVEQERVPETVACANAMAGMVHLDGATLLFPTSYGYFNPYMLKAAKQNPSVNYMHCGGLWAKGDPLNAHSYFGYIDEAVYVSGIVAGHMTKSKKLGFVAAKPIPQVLRNINAFLLGAQSVDPSITMQVIFTGDWFMPVREAEVTNSLADQGADVITCHVDSPKVVIQTAEKRGLYTCGYHTDQAPLAPKGYLTGAEWNWTYLYPKWITALQAGGSMPNYIRGGFKESFIKSSPYGAMVPAAARTQADAARAGFTAGNFAIFKGPLKDNKGNTVIAAGTVLDEHDPVLESMSYLVAGVSGSAS